MLVLQLYCMQLGIPTVTLSIYPWESVSQIQSMNGTVRLPQRVPPYMHKQLQASVASFL